MDRRTFVLGTAAAALHATRLFELAICRQVELGLIDGSVGGNQFTAVQFLDYLSSIKLTWAMISLPPAVLGRRGRRATGPRPRRPARDQAAARARICVPERPCLQSADSARSRRRSPARSKPHRFRRVAACVAFSAATLSVHRLKCISTT